MCQNLHPTPELNRSPSTHTPGESGARAAVLGFRPAVREAAQRNTQVAVTAVSGGGGGGGARPMNRHQPRVRRQRLL